MRRFSGWAWEGGGVGAFGSAPQEVGGYSSRLRSDPFLLAHVPTENASTDGRLGREQGREGRRLSPTT